MCSRTRGRKKDAEQSKALKRRQEARRVIEEKQLQRKMEEEFCI